MHFIWHSNDAHKSCLSFALIELRDQSGFKLVYSCLVREGKEGKQKLERNVKKKAYELIFGELIILFNTQFMIKM